MNEKLKREDYVETFRDYTTMKEFLDDLVENDVWSVISMDGARIREVSQTSFIPERTFLYCDEDDVKRLQQEGGFYLSTPNGSFIISPLAFFTLKQKLGVNCRAASKMIGKAEYKKFADFCNIAFSLATEKDEGSILVRGNRIIAMHSGKYDVHKQNELIEKTQQHLDNRFENNMFLGGSYSHDLTNALWSLGSKHSSITKAYVQAWKDAGLNMDELKDFHPVVEFITSDTGVHTVEYYPKMTVNKKYYGLGTPIKIKHYGGKKMSDIEEALDMVFAAIQDGSEKLGKMLDLKIENPIETFVAAAKKVGLHKIVPKMLKEQLDIEKISYGISSTSTAFMVYDAITDITASAEYDKLKDSTKMNVQECLTRLISLDWKSIDKPGVRDFD